MLRDRDAVANLAVKDLKVAKNFYEGTLGLEPAGTEGDELIVYRSGRSTLNVYRSKEAGTNKATAVTWAVGKEVRKVMEALSAKGVRFEHYDMPGLKLDGDVHVGDDLEVAWFKDPGRQHSEHRQPIARPTGRALLFEEVSYPLVRHEGKSQGAAQRPAQ